MIENVKIQSVINLDPDKISNAVLKRLVEEVKFDAENGTGKYNRTHNRHNRNSGSNGVPLIIKQEQS